MSSQLECIGVPIEGPEDLQSFLERISDRLDLDVQQGSVKHLRWTDDSGAALAVHLEKDGVACITPFFVPADGLCRWKVTSSAPRDDADCAHCGGADVDVVENGETVTRSTIRWLHYQPYRKWLQSRRTYGLEVAAFAERIALFADEAAFTEGEHPGLGSLKLAANAFLPGGMFIGTANVREAASVTMAGRIVRAESLENSLGRAFWRLRIETLPGRVDVVAAADALPRAPAMGEIVLVDAWMVGRPVEQVPEPGWLDRFLGRRG